MPAHQEITPVVLAGPVKPETMREPVMLLYPPWKSGPRLLVWCVVVTPPVASGAAAAEARRKHSPEG